MIGRHVLGVAGAVVLASSLVAVAACGGSPDEEGPAKAAAALESANVSIALYDEQGVRVGDGAGVLIAPNLVLTSAHLVAGKAEWRVTTADGKTTVRSQRGLTYDWRVYESPKSHPRRRDVAVLYLEESIALASYPKLASSKQRAGAHAVRVRHDGESFERVATTLDGVRGFPNAYLVDMPTSETVRTGGAVVNEAGEIVGVVTGRGMQSGKLHVARTDALVSWMSPKIACAGGPGLSSASSATISTYGSPKKKSKPKDDDDCPDAGKDAGSSSSDGSDAGAGGGAGDDGTCDDGDGLCSGNKCDAGGSNRGGSDGAKDDDDGAGSGSGSGSEADDPSGGGGGTGTAGDDPCGGPDEDPDVCPPEADDCSGPSCGGGVPDRTIDYGNCACTSTKTTTKPPPVR